MEGNSNRVPHFVKAMSPVKLQEKMIKVNTENNREHKWQITHDGRQWVAWYYKIMHDDIKL